MRIDDIRYGPLDYPMKQWEAEPVTLFKKGWTSIELPAPPANSSPTTKTELKTIAWMLREVFPERVEEIQRQDALDFLPVGSEKPGAIENEFIRLLQDNGIWMRQSEQARIARIASDLATISLHFKKQFDRPRPYQLFSEFGMFGTATMASMTADSPAYPSTHALIGAFLGTLLAEQYPRLKDDLRALGQRIGENRVVAGLHFPSDVQAGVDLARSLRLYFKG